MSDWDELGTLWRSNEPPELGDLRQRMNRQTALLRAWVGFEVLIGLLAFAFGIWLLVDDDIPLIGGAIVAFALFAHTLSFRSWRGAFRVETGTPRDTIDSALARNDAIHRYLRANYIVSIGAVALIGLMVATDAFGTAAEPARLHNALWAVTIGFGAIVVWLAGCGLYAERLTRERARLVDLGRALGVLEP